MDPLVPAHENRSIISRATEGAIRDLPITRRAVQAVDPRHGSTTQGRAKGASAAVRSATCLIPGSLLTLGEILS